MCVQPLLENAIQYSVEKNVDGCSVDLSVFREGKTVAIRIQNEGSRIDTDILNKMETKKTGRKGSGIGLANINRRIQLIFGSQYGLFFQNRDNLAIVTIRVPVAAAKGGSECCD
jgi:two-component system sensor histidine kinase YesM